MNVIFLDFDGVLDTDYYTTNEDVEKKIEILSKICHKYDCKVVIEASAKRAIDEETLEIDPESDWVNFIFDMFKKYDIECIGRTPSLKRYVVNDSYISMWKDDEIRLYLFRHPEIDHYCVIDDDDLASYHRKSDLDQVRNHLLKTIYYSNDNKEEEGLQEYHEEEIGRILKKDNEIKKYALKRKNNIKI